mmetsp:Transcript_14963/g.63040  ORF Transcript_14963/g.63040 Transcript_14963/m.63040 type:complete len:453 (-) Transcript_14963:61-1419(-)
MKRYLDEVGDVGGELLDDGLVEALHVLEEALVILGDEVDGHTLAAETAGTTDAVEVVLRLGGEVEVDDEGHLLDVDTAGEEVGGDEHAGGARAELAHDDVAGVLVHVTVGGGDGEVAGAHLVREPVNLAAGVGEDDGLGDGEGLVEIAEGVELPLLLVDVDVKLLDTLEGELVALDENAHRLRHELSRNLKRLGGHRRGEHANLELGGEQLEDVVDLILETAAEHLIRLVEGEDLDVIRLESAAAEHVVHAAGGADHDVNAALEDALILAHGRATDARVALHVEVIAERAHHLLNLLRELARGGEHESLALLLLVVELLQDAGAEGGRLTGTGLRLLDHVEALGEGHDAALLNRGGLLETVRVDAAKEVLVEVHRVERLVNLGPVGDGHLAVLGAILGEQLLHAAVVSLIVETTFAGHDSFGLRLRNRAFVTKGTWRWALRVSGLSERGVSV